MVAGRVMGRSEKPLIVVAGPTASGKTGLAIKLAKQFDGEIICADSRTVYEGMDVGTAKPTAAERLTVPHWGLDLVEPGERFTAADFKKYATNKIEEIRARGSVPFLVGGTGLYIDAVVFDFDFGPPVSEADRQKLQQLSVEQLQKYCKENNISLPQNHQNKRHLVRTIERRSISVERRIEPIDNCIVVGVTTKRGELRTRIEQRSEQIFLNNVVEEATKLGEKYGWDSEAMTGNIYPLVRKMIEGEIDEATLRGRFSILDWRLAKRQMTWLRRNPFIIWARLEEAEQYLSTRLADG